jgi:uncharacterized membrane protein
MNNASHPQDRDRSGAGMAARTLLPALLEDDENPLDSSMEGSPIIHQTLMATSRRSSSNNDITTPVHTATTSTNNTNNNALETSPATTVAVGTLQALASSSSSSSSSSAFLSNNNNNNNNNNNIIKISSSMSLSSSSSDGLPGLTAIRSISPGRALSNTTSSSSSIPLSIVKVESSQHGLLATTIPNEMKTTASVVASYINSGASSLPLHLGLTSNANEINTLSVGINSMMPLIPLASGMATMVTTSPSLLFIDQERAVLKEYGNFMRQIMAVAQDQGIDYIHIIT